MDIAVISDQHLGYGWDTEREDDPFRNCREAFEQCRDADIILLPGDLFDRKVPKQEVLGRAIDLFSMFDGIENDVHTAEDSDVQAQFRGTPIIAIHGTHERRSGEYVNPIQLLEKMGFCCHLHNQTIILEKEGERVAVHGMSGVPERYAPKVLQKFDPQPIQDATNILMLHQSIENFVYTDDQHPALKMEHLPHGFDHIINGHIHWKNLEMQDSDKPLLIPGSTITTQINKTEADNPKGFLRIDTSDQSVTFHELEQTRDVHHIEIDVTGMSGSEIRRSVGDRLEELGNTDRRPLTRVILHGETDADISLTELTQEHGKKALLSISKKIDPEQHDPSNQIDHTEETAMELGMKLLKQKADIDRIDQLFELLTDDRIDESMDLLLQDVETENTAADGERTETAEKTEDSLQQFVDER